MEFLQTMPFYYYLLAGSGCLILIAIFLYFVGAGRIRIPAIAGCILFSLTGGIAVGVVVMYGLGFHWEREPQKIDRPSFGGGGGPPGGGEMKKGGVEGAGKGEGKKGGNAKGGTEKKGGGDMMAGMAAMGQSQMGNFRPPPPKDQLVTLVMKLDLLTSKAPLLNLTDEQKTKIRENLNGLEAKTEIKDEDAKNTVDAILEIVEGDRKSLEMVGFRWPGSGGDIPRPIPNPFKTKSNPDHLKALQERLGEKGY